MEWRLFATLAEAAGDTTVQVDTDTDPTLEDALGALLEKRPALEETVIDRDGGLYDHIRLLHEGRDPFVEERGLETAIEEDAELALFPPVSGG